MDGKIHFIQNIDRDKTLAFIKDKMSVYVNKDNPNEAVMVCDGIILHCLIYILAAVFSIIGFIIAFVLMQNIFGLMGILKPLKDVLN